MKVFDSRKLLVFSGLLLIATLAVHGAASKETAVVRDLSFNSNGDSVEVRIAASAHAQYTYFELSNPHRLVVDFRGVQNNIGFKEKPIDAAGVQRVRTSTFTDKTRKATRIVFDLVENTTYKISDDGEGHVRVVFGAEPPTRIAQTRETEKTESAPLNLTAGPPAVPGIKASEEKPLPSIPRSLTASALQTFLTQTAQASPSLLTMQEPPQTVQSAAGAQAGQKYTGEIVTITAKDMDVKDFFTFISDVSGLNVVIDPGVTGAINMALTDVPWDQALDIALKSLQLGSELEGNVLRIAKRDTLLAEEKARTDLRTASESAVELSAPKSYILNYTKADTVATTLRAPGILSARGSLITDVRRNALIVTDIPVQIEKIDKLIQFLDAPAQQVEIEARLLSANKSFSKNLGTQLGFILGNKSQNKVTGVGAVGNSPLGRTPAPSVAVGGGLPLSVNLPTAATSGVSFLLGAGADVLLDEIITAAESKGTAKLISKPHVMTQNNLAATVSQGTQIPVQTSQNNTVSTQFLNFSLRLTATPQITDIGTILLQVQIENSQPDFARAVNGIPSVGTQAVNTSVLMGDGETLVVGGILLDQDTNNINQVPGFGSLPLIGHLFKSSQTIKSTAELLFFITPRIQTTGNLNIVPPGQQK